MVLKHFPELLMPHTLTLPTWLSVKVLEFEKVGMFQIAKETGA